MTQLPTLSVSLGRYDRTRPLLDGRVTLDRYRLAFRSLGYGEIASQTFGSAELDIGEVSFGGLLAALDRGVETYLGLPAFVSLGFRHDTIYVAAGSPVRRPEDLAGRRIGLPEFYGTTPIWLRGMLQDCHGVDFRSIGWVVGAVEGGKAPAPRPHADGIRCTYPGEGPTLVDRLVAGEIDALFSHRVPKAFHDGRIRRLYDDPAEAEAAYHHETGLVPLLHLPVVRASLIEADPALHGDLYAAFCTAKAIALAELRDTVVFTVSLPSLQRAVEDAEALFGGDFWPYGVDENRKAIDAFLRYAHEQGLTRRRFSIGEVFPDHPAS